MDRERNSCARAVGEGGSALYLTGGTALSSASNPGRLLGFLALLIVAAELLSLTEMVQPPHAALLRCLAGKSVPYVSGAFFGVFLVHLARAVSRDERLITIAAGLFGESLMILATNKNLEPVGLSWLMLDTGTGLGFGSILVQLGYLFLRRSREWELRLRLLSECLLIPGFVVASLSYLDLTSALHPRIYDYALYGVDEGLGFQPSFVLGRFLKRTPVLMASVEVLYARLPLVVAAVHAFNVSKTKSFGIETLESFLLIGVIGFTLYHLFPVVGPIYAFQDAYPYSPPPSSRAWPAFVETEVVVWRNCMPSLHTAWALAVLLRTRGLGLLARLGGLAFLLSTVVATLGLGFHYAIDLVVAVPFAVAVDALPEVLRAGWPRPATIALIVCAGLVAAWLVGLATIPEVLGAHPSVTWPLVLSTVLAAALCRQVLCRGTAQLQRPLALPRRLEWKWPVVALAAVFTISGFAGLVYEVVFSKFLALTFGSTSRANATVLCTYMAGLALGAWLGGKVAARTLQPLKLYASCEIGVGLWCLATPLMFGFIRAVYTTFGSGIDPGSVVLSLAQIVLGAAVLLPPTLLMGMTMPALVEDLERRGHMFARSVALLYAANVFGAAIGALTSGYFILPSLGMTGSTMLAVLMNFVAAVAALGLRVLSQRSASVEQAPAFPQHTSKGNRLAATVALMILGLGGFLTLALEVVDIHLLGVVAGTSAYAFSLMLFAFLVGLALGSGLARRYLVRAGLDRLATLALLEMGLAAILLCGVFFWDYIPDYFASFESYPITRTFAQREVVRGIVCCLIMIPQSALIGAIYPVAVDLYAASVGGSRVRALGRASAINTLGNVIGTLVATFLLLPLMGSLHSIHALAALALFLSLLASVTVKHGRVRRVALTGGIAAFLFGIQPGSFDWTTIANGANVYFAKQHYGKVIDVAESADGGLSSVALRLDAAGQPHYTLLTNGKFQGDNAREMRAQLGFALCPLLHTTARDSALVIGYGTGVSAGTIYRAGFRSVDIAELAADIVSLADRYFSDVNGAVTRQPGVQLFISDGRNYLQLTRNRYDLISMEVSSIWFAGAASLYSREFYALAKQRLKEAGVLQQWVQLHHISVADIASILATVRSEFSSVYLYYVGHQGIIVACEKACPPSKEALAALEAAQGLAEIRAWFEGSLATLYRAMLLGPTGVDRFIESVARELGVDWSSLISTDDNLLLEYSTPRGNVRPYKESLEENLAALSRWREDAAKGD